MKESFKKGFGWITGCVFGLCALNLVAREVMKRAAKNETFMEYEKKNNPDTYEALKKYQPKTEEES